MDVVRPCFRVDANLRPEGRDGPLVRTLASYEAYWDRWAEPWEFQALLKARSVAGDAELGAAFDEAADRRLWRGRSPPTTCARAPPEGPERGASWRGGPHRPRGEARPRRHPRHRVRRAAAAARPRPPRSRSALADDARGAGASWARPGYVDDDDAGQLADAYRFLRRSSTGCSCATAPRSTPCPPTSRAHAHRPHARLPRHRRGQRPRAARRRPRRHQATVRAIHERLYFRPLLEAFAARRRRAAHRPGAVEARLDRVRVLRRRCARAPPSAS